MSQQYLRAIKLILSAADGQAIDLSQLHVQFTISQATIETPASAIIRVYNLSQATLNKITGEFQYVSLSVGYQGTVAPIFQGQIRQFNSGLKQDAVTTMIDLICQDGDKGYNWSVVNKTLAAGWTHDDAFNALAESFKKNDVGVGYKTQFSPTSFPRGRVFYGPARGHMRRLADNAGAYFSIRDNSINVVGKDEASDKEVIEMNSATGVIGMPEQTIDGIVVTCLINPKIRYNTTVKLDNSAIQTNSISVAYGAVNYTAGFSRNGLYKVFSVNTHGDTRGNDWYQQLVCIAQPGQGTQALGGAQINAVAGRN